MPLPPAVRGVSEIPTDRSDVVADTVVDLLDSLDLDKALPDLRAALRSLRHVQALRVTVDVEADRKRLVRDLRDPDTDTDTILEALIGLRARAGGADQVQRSDVREAAVDAEIELRAQVLGCGRTLLVDTLRPVFDSLVAEATRLVEKLPEEITGDRDALHAGPKAAAAWLRLTAIAEDLEAIADVADELRSAGVLETGQPHGGEFAPLDYRYRLPGLLGREVVIDGRHLGTTTTVGRDLAGTASAPLLLVQAIRSGAGPALLDHGDVLALAEERRALREEQHQAHRDRQAQQYADDLAARRPSVPADPMPAA